MLSFSVFDPGSGPGVLTPQPSCNCTTLALCGTRSGSGRGGIFRFGSVSWFANIGVDPGRFAGCIDARRVLEKSVDLLKIAFLAARGGRGRGCRFVSMLRPSVLQFPKSSRSAAEAFAPKITQDHVPRDLRS